MPRYRVFLGAPSPAELYQGTIAQYTWETVETGLDSEHSGRQESSDEPHSKMTYPPSAIEAASRRLSSVYENIIFGDNSNSEQYEQDSEYADAPMVDNDTTEISWPPTASALPNAEHSRAMLTFLHTTTSSSRFLSLGDTQDTDSFNASDASSSSVGRFPGFAFAPQSIVPLSSLSTRMAQSDARTRKVHVLVALLEIEGPFKIQIKKGVDAGKEVSMLKLISGDEEGAVCKIVAWREVADEWAGNGASKMRVKRGDIVFLENLNVTYEQATTASTSVSPSLTASPFLRSRAEICYRTMPSTSADNLLRPDLRLAMSDSAVRRVAAVVRWFQRIAGLAEDPA